MGEERATVTQSLLVREGHDDGSGELQTSSSVTTTLVLSTLVAACISFGFGCVSVIMEELGLSLAEFSLFGSMLNIGSILGALASGKTTDLLGRKCTMWVLNLFYIVGWLSIAFAKVPWLLDVGRLLLGFRNGIAGYLVPVYVAEITPKNLRGRFTALVQMMGVIGISMMYIIGPFIDWRILALIGIIPSLLQFPLLFFIPESPRWLAKVGREKEFETALLSLRGEKANIFEEANAIKDYTESLKSFSWGGILDLFQPKYAHPLIIGIGLMALQHSGGANAYAYYSGSIFVSAGLSKYIGLSTLAVVEVLCCFKLTLDVKCIPQKLKICIFMFLQGDYASAAFLLEYHSFYRTITSGVRELLFWHSLAYGCIWCHTK